MPAMKEVFDLLGDDIVELSTENDTLKKKLVKMIKKWFQESTAKLLKQIDVEEKANLFMSRMENRWKIIKKLAYIYLIVNYGKTIFIILSRKKVKCKI